MSPEEITEMGKALCEAAARRLQIACPTSRYLDFSLQDAYAVQEALVKESLSRGRLLSGRKIGYARTPVWDDLGINEPCYGSMFRDRTFQDCREVRFEEFVEPQLEIEILFALKKSIDAPDITVERILDATDYVAPAFEIIEARTLPDGRQMNDTVADNHSFGACLIGAQKMKPTFNEIGAQTVAIHKSTMPIQTGEFTVIMGNPVHSMVWLAKRMFAMNTPLMAGDLVLSGSAVAPIPVAQGDAFTVRYATFGENAVRFT